MKINSHLLVSAVLSYANIDSPWISKIAFSNLLSKVEREKENKFNSLPESLQVLYRRWTEDVICYVTGGSFVRTKMCLSLHCSPDYCSLIRDQKNETQLAHFPKISSHSGTTSNTACQDLTWNDEHLLMTFVQDSYWSFPCHDSHRGNFIRKCAPSKGTRGRGRGRIGLCPRSRKVNSETQEGHLRCNERSHCIRKLISGGVLSSPPTQSTSILNLYED